MATYRGKKLTPIEDAALEVIVNKLAPNPEDYRVDDEVNEAVHPMGVHVTSVPGKKVEGLPAYKVTKVGSKVKAHGGLKVGEHIHDNHIDDLADMGHKIKTEEVEQSEEKEENMKDEHSQKTLADYAADVLTNTVGEGKLKDMVTGHMTTGKGMSYNQAVKKAQKDLNKIAKKADIPKTKVEEDNHEMGHDVMSKKRMAQAKKNIKDVDKVDDLSGVKEELSAAQKKLPPGLQKAIMKKKGKTVSEDMHKKKKKHDCASKVKSEEYGIGYCIPEQHTMLEDGTVTHYDVEFDDYIVENFPVEELEILVSEMHEHYDNEEKNNIEEVKFTKVPENEKHTAKMKKAAKMYKSVPATQRGTGSAGKRGGDSGFKPTKMGEERDSMKEEVQFDQEADFTFVEHNTWDIQIADEYTYEDFIKAAVAITDGSDDAVQIAEKYFEAGDITLILEEFTRSDINDKIDTHKKAGSKVTDPKYTTKDDKLHAEFTVTDKKGMRKRHIFHGNIRRHENLGKVAVSPEKEL